MYRDPIVEETRRLRQQYADAMDHNLDAIFDDIQKRQKQTKARLVALRPKPPKAAPAEA